MESLCQIEIVKDGIDFAARAHLVSGQRKEYRHPILEEVFTEMVIDLQDVLDDQNVFYDKFKD